MFVLMISPGGSFYIKTNTYIRMTKASSDIVVEKFLKNAF